MRPITTPVYPEPHIFFFFGFSLLPLLRSNPQAKLNCTLAKDKCVDVLDHLAYARYNLQDYAGALVTSRQLLSLDPHNGRLSANRHWK